MLRAYTQFKSLTQGRERAIFDISNGKSRVEPNGTSLENAVEIEAMLDTMDDLLRIAHGRAAELKEAPLLTGTSFGIIAMYKARKTAFLAAQRERYNQKEGEKYGLDAVEITENCEVSTVDGYQGKE